jgi:histidinol-phosphate/aromatic aminotransferase/cobyric acid decarboxylase-like protein
VEFADAAQALRAAAADGFLLRDFSRQPGLAQCLRITIGSRGENDRLLATLERA